MIPNHESKKLARLAIFLRVYGVVSLLLFSTLLLGFLVRSPLLADPTPGAPAGLLNWLIWNGVECAGEPCHVPPMLFIIYIVWGAFFLLAARKPLAYLSFLSFTMWANFAHAVLMAVQATAMSDRYWSKWLTDIPFTGLLALGILAWRPSAAAERRERTNIDQA